MIEDEHDGRQEKSCRGRDVFVPIENNSPIKKEMGDKRQKKTDSCKNRSDIAESLHRHPPPLALIRSDNNKIQQKKQ